MQNTLTKIWKGSPNFWKGRKNYKPEAIVLHITTGSIQSCDSWFNNPKSQVSAHYCVGKNGEIHQYVAEENTAWHAGIVYNPSWQFLKQNINPNLYTLGIEHEGKEYDTWPKEQKEKSALLIKELCGKWNIQLDRYHIIGHYEITAKKPNDPAINKEIINEIISLAQKKEKRTIKNIFECFKKLFKN